MRRRRWTKYWHKSAALVGALLLVSACTGVVPPTDGPGDTAVGTPAAETPTADAPATDAPATEVPAAEVPATEVPAEDATGSDATGSDVSGSEGITVAERVTFEDGGYSATRSGTMALDGEMQYAFAASAGQTLHIQSISPEAPVSFTVYAPGGESWEGQFQPSEVYIFTAQFTVPVHGDYLVVVAVTDDVPSTGEGMPTGVTEANYEVVFTIDTSSTPPGQPQLGAVDRISFEAGTTTTERSGMLPTGPAVQQYLLSANAGWTLTVDATSDGTPLSMTIESPSGNQWIPEMMTSPDGYTIGHQVTLPEPGYYLVTLTKPDHSPSTNYTITFTLE